VWPASVVGALGVASEKGSEKWNKMYERSLHPIDRHPLCKRLKNKHTSPVSEEGALGVLTL